MLSLQRGVRGYRFHYGHGFVILGLTLALLSAGCGGTAMVRAARLPTKPREATIDIQAKAFSRAVNLRQSDIPQFSDTAQHPTAGKPLSGVCGLPGAAPSEFEASSPEFVAAGGALTVESLIELMASARRNTLEFDSLRRSLASPSGRRCLAALFDSSTDSTENGEHVHAVHRDASLEPLSLRSGAGKLPAIGYVVHYVADITRDNAGISREFHVRSERLSAFVLVGRTTVSLFSAGFDRAFPIALERRLISALRRRAANAAQRSPRAVR